MLCEGLSIKPHLFTMSRMAVLEDFYLVIGRNLSPLSNMLIFANLSGLGAFLAMETKKCSTSFRGRWETNPSMS